MTSLDRVMPLDLDDARAEARLAYENWACTLDARKELKKLSGEARAALEGLLATTQGKYVSIDEALIEVDAWRENRLEALAQAMLPLVEWWEESNGPVTTTVYSNQKKTDERSDDGASLAMKWLADEMTSLTDGQRFSPQTVRTMYMHIRR